MIAPPAPSVCQRCSSAIEWIPDDPADPTIGWWVGGPVESEVCVPGAGDDDRWHRPTGADADNGWPVR